MKKETTAEYPALDIVRFLSAVWFILIHCNIAYLSDNELFRYTVFLVRDIGLAAFFASNGFFTMEKIRTTERAQQPEAFRKKWLGYAKVYLIWSLIYLPVSVYGEFVVYQESLVRGTGKLIWDFFMTGVHYYTWMLWYFPAMLWSLLALYLLIRIPVPRGMNAQRGRAWGLSPRAIVLLGAALYGVGIFVQQSSQTAWGQVYYRFFYGTQNAAFFGFLFVAWGMYSAGRRADAGVFPVADVGAGSSADGVARAGKSPAVGGLTAASAPPRPKVVSSDACRARLTASAAVCTALCLALHGTVWGEILRPVCCILVFELLVSVKRTAGAPGAGTIGSRAVDAPNVESDERWTSGKAGSVSGDAPTALRKNSAAGSIFGALRRMSRDLFLVHMLFVILFLLILRRDCPQPDLISTIGTLSCSLAAAGLLERLRAKETIYDTD